MVKRFIFIGLFLGIIFIIVNVISWGFGAVYISLFIPVLYYLFYILFPCSGEGCLPGVSIGIIFGIIVLPLLLAFLGYLIDTKKYPYTRRKIIYVFAIIFFFLAINTIAFLETRAFIHVEQLSFYNYHNLNYSQHYELDNRYRSVGVGGCEGIGAYEEEGSCYGYFAGLNNDVSLCNKYTEENAARYSDKEYIISECIINFSIRKNNEKYCIDNINRDVLKQKCLAIYYITKKESDKCNNIQGSWRGNCLERENRYNELQNVNPIIKRYTEIRGLNKASY